MRWALDGHSEFSAPTKMLTFRRPEERRTKTKQNKTKTQKKNKGQTPHLAIIFPFRHGLLPCFGWTAYTAKISFLNTPMSRSWPETTAPPNHNLCFLASDGALASTDHSMSALNNTSPDRNTARKFARESRDFGAKKLAPAQLPTWCPHIAEMVRQGMSRTICN